jgi:NADH-quinone oxidoreductase subunit M
MILGETKPVTEGFADVNSNEMTVLLGLAGLVIVFGIYPKPLLDIANPAVDEIIKIFQAGLIK